MNSEERLSSVDGLVVKALNTWAKLDQRGEQKQQPLTVCRVVVLAFEHPVLGTQVVLTFCNKEIK